MASLVGFGLRTNRAPEAQSLPRPGNVVNLTLYPVGHGLPAVPLLRSALGRNHRSKRKIGGTSGRPSPTVRTVGGMASLVGFGLRTNRAPQAQSLPRPGNVVNLTLYPVGHGLPAVPLLRSALGHHPSKRKIGGTVRRPCPTARRRREVRGLSRRLRAAPSPKERARRAARPGGRALQCAAGVRSEASPAACGRHPLRRRGHWLVREAEPYKCIPCIMHYAL